MAIFNGRSDRGRSVYNRGVERPPMHSAVCSKCGAACQVPFKPTGNRPLFCNDCFKLEGGGNRRNDDRRSQNPQDRPMYDAICDNCGNRCQIPFQPRQGREVFCSHCFEQKEKGNQRSDERPRNNVSLDEVNAKLDKILSLLSTSSKEEVSVEPIKLESTKKVKKAKPEITVEKVLPVVEEAVVDFPTPPVKKIVKKTTKKIIPEQVADDISAISEEQI